MKEYRYIRISNLVPDSRIGAKLAEVEAYGDTVDTEAERKVSADKAEPEPEEEHSALKIAAVVLSGLAFAAVVSAVIIIIINRKKA